MTYSAIYCALISKRLEQPISKKDGYCERHHIIPKSEGGSDDKDNLVNLTAREHYIAHRLLAKIYGDVKMWCALNRLVHGNDFSKYNRVSSREYQIIKQNLSEKMKGMPPPNKGKHLSEEHRRKVGLANKGKKRSDEIRRRMSESRKGRIPWNKGVTGTRLSEETRRKISQANKGRTPSLEHRKHLSEAMKRIGRIPPWTGMHWFNNGEKNVRASSCPDGFVAGCIWVRHKTKK